MRRQFMLLSSSRDRRLGEAWFEAIKSEYKHKIVPPENPNNIRLQKLGQEIVEAARKGILKQAATARPAMMLPRYQHENMMMRMIKAFSGKREFSHQSANLEGFKWEFVLVDEPHIVNAFCAPAGKIFVFTGLLNMFRDAAAIASVIGHEVYI
ncbi:mitochondrial metalloendopeptidase OMA1-like [Salvia miltiorrhiza]|uniref:mitochondrial metalloendopeptidase OMA1-like n=1 Tax=Salvia miltiorrhiza TaxID=226208 RepID=UPI0025AC051F|nr:mitochondrial metalloendopeptidase OMA1-like [Salvia miltiorrhiza]